MNDLVLLLLTVWICGFLWLSRQLVPMLVYDRATMSEQLRAVGIWITWPISLPVLRLVRAARNRRG